MRCIPMAPTSGGVRNGGNTASTNLQHQLLAALRERQARGEPLTDLRCGPRICELLAGMQADGMIDLRSMQRDANAVTVDVEIDAQGA